jgi:membrane-bound serine protease (ClpP class)
VSAPAGPALLGEIAGPTTKPRGFTMRTAGDTIVARHMGFMTRLLDTLLAPDILSLLFIAGIMGIAFEVLNPGVVLPGALGAVALITALYGFSILPTSWAGVALIALGIVLFVVDAHVVTHGALTVSGIVALAVGLLMLFHDAPSAYRVDTWFAVAVAGTIGAFMAFALGKAVSARRRPSAMPSLVGAEGIVRDGGFVFVRGELWRATAADGAMLEPGEHVAVDAVDGLRLVVHRV